MKPSGRAIIWMFVYLVFTQCNHVDSADQNNQGNKLNFHSNPSPVFTHDLTDLNSIRGITPLGGVSDNTIADHTYLFTKDDANQQPTKVPVYAPTDMTLTAIAYRKTSAGNQYLLYFQISKEVKIYIDHIDDPVQAIKNAGPSTPAESNNTQTSDPSKYLKFKAGDLIAHTKGTIYGVWDFGLTNSTVENRFANMDRYRTVENRRTLHSDCPYDYFADSLKKNYQALYGLMTGKPYQGATCRSASRDVAGTLSGAWFLDKDPYDNFRESIAIANDFNGEVRIGGLGNEMLVMYSQPSPAPDPESIQVGDTVCYEDGSNYAFFDVLSDTKVNVAYGSGDCPTKFPQTQTQVYVR